MEKEIQNIYFEVKIPETSSEKVWNDFIEIQNFVEVFKVDPDKRLFEENSGRIQVKTGIFQKFNAEFQVLMLKKYKNLLIDIISDECASSILITIEEVDGTVLFRLDHRSFVGDKKKDLEKIFELRWKKAIELLIKKDRRDKRLKRRQAV
ncbi:MAG: hypothetical protein ACRCS8_02205 [Brevinema sp.]